MSNNPLVPINLINRTSNAYEPFIKSLAKLSEGDAPVLEANALKEIIKDLAKANEREPEKKIIKLGTIPQTTREKRDLIKEVMIAAME